MAEQLAHRGVVAVARLVEFAPASGSLALWVRHADVEADSPGPPAPLWTDGHTVHYRPAFAALPPEAQAGWLAHQVLHVALRHAPRMAAWRRERGEVDEELFNLCADAIVQSALAHLRWLRLPEGVPALEDVLERIPGLPAVAGPPLLHWDVERLYAALDDREPGRGGQRDGQRDGPRARALRAMGREAARDLQPAPAEGEHPEQEAQAARDWAERLRRGLGGDGAQSLLRTLLADLPRERTPWAQVLRSQAAHALSRRPGPSWSRPTRSWLANQGRAGPGRRLPWTPGTQSTTPAPRLVLVLDVSGSVEAPLLARFCGEIGALVRRLEAALVLVIGDDAVREVRRFEPGRARLDDLAVRGGGGTDFAPLLAEAVRHRPDLIVVLTDLEGPAGPPPRCPVLWAVPPSRAAARAPFGRVLVLG